MRSINRNTLLASTFVHDDDDDDPSPAGGAMPVPAIIKDGSANDNAAAVAPSGPRLVPPSLPVHPALESLLRVQPDEIKRRAETLKLGAPSREVEVYKNQIITLDSWIEVGASEIAGVPIKTVPVPDDIDPVEYVLGTIPPLRDHVARAIAVNLSREFYEAASKKAMSDGGKLGANRRWGDEQISEPHPDPETKTKKSYSAWIVRGSELTGCPCDVIRKVSGLHRHAPDMFKCLEDGRITHLNDAVNLHKRFPKSSADRLGCLLSWRKTRIGNRTLRLVDHMPTYVSVKNAEREERRGKFDKSHKRGSGKLVDAHGPGYDLYFGTMEERGKEIAPESVDIAYADILYDTEHLEPMAEQVGFLAAGHLPPGGSLVLCAGNFNTRKAVNAVMKGAERAGFAFEEPIVIYIHYLDGKDGKGLPIPVRGKIERGVGKIDGLPHFLFRKAGGLAQHKIASLYFESLAQANGEPIYHLYNKNTRCIADMVAAIRPDADPQTGGPPLRIVDYCMGWGSTGVAVRRGGHTFIGFECSNDDNRFVIARTRIAEARPGVWPNKTDKSGKAKTNGKAHK